MKNLISNAKSTIIAKSTETLDSASEAVKNTVSSAMELGKGGLITQNGDVNSNADSSKGFAFEHTHEAAFNANAISQGQPFEAIRIPPGGINDLLKERKIDAELNTERLGEPDIIIINTDTNDIVLKIQAKCGQESYVTKAISDEKYADTTDVFVVNSDLPTSITEFDNVNTVIEYAGITSMPISEATAKAIAEDPNFAATLIEAGAETSQILGGAALGGSIGALYSTVMSSIKLLGRYYRGEVIGKAQVEQAAEEVLSAIKSGALRGGVVKLIQFFMDANAGSALPVAVASICIEVFPLIKRYLEDDITLEQLIQQTGTKSLSTGIIVIVCMTYPPIGISLLGFGLAKAILTEFAFDSKIASYLEDKGLTKRAKAIRKSTSDSLDKVTSNTKSTINNSLTKVSNLTNSGIGRASAITQKAFKRDALE